MSQNISKIFMSTALVLIGLLVFVSMMSSGGNLVGNTALYLSIFCFVLGVLVPKGASYIILILAGYSDLFKRFLVLDTSISQLDLVYVLAMAPITLAGIVISLLISGILRQTLSKADFVRFCVCSGVLLVVAISVFLRGDGLRGLRVLADYGAFVYLYFALPLLFPSRAALMKYTRVAVLIFIPVALYGIWQRLYGLSAFELDYLDTGLSTESRQFDDIAFRPFSTLNAASSLTMVCAACMLLTYALMRAGFLFKVVGIALMALFGVACVMTFTRTGWLCACVAPFLVFAFRHRSTTLLFYLGGIATFLTLVLCSEWFMDNLQGWQAEISGEGDHGRSTQAFRITTLYDRFLGFSNLKNPDNWTPFGIKEATAYGDGRFDDTAFSHDAFSSFLFNRGYVLSGILVIGGVIAVVKLHSAMLAQQMQQRKVTSLMVGSCAALLVSLLAGGYIFQFPANIFLWITFCLAAHCFTDESEVLEAEQEESIEEN